MFRIQDWSPNSLERQCLQHLDSSENWIDILKIQQPSRGEIQSWKPFWRIFVINFILFLAVFALLFGSLEIGYSGLAGLREDFKILLGVIGTMAAAFAGYVTYLYRRTWNRRANQMNSLVDSLS